MWIDNVITNLFVHRFKCMHIYDGLSEKRNKKTEYVNKIINISEDVK